MFFTHEFKHFSLVEAAIFYQTDRKLLIVNQTMFNFAYPRQWSFLPISAYDMVLQNESVFISIFISLNVICLFFHVYFRHIVTICIVNISFINHFVYHCKMPFFKWPRLVLSEIYTVKLYVRSKHMIWYDRRFV